MNPFDVIHHLRRAAKGAHPLFVALPLVADAERAPILAPHKGERMSEGSGLRGLFFENKLLEEGPDGTPK